MLAPSKQKDPPKDSRPSKEQVLQFVIANGPSVPNDVMKKLGSDTFLIGAYLSELVANKKLSVSAMKVGGSPLYYAPGQEYKLQNFTKYLNEKDRLAYNILKDKRVLTDREQTPLIRVALRTIKDFAFPIEISQNGEKTLYWRWYLISNDQANAEIATNGQKPAEPVKPAIIEKKETFVEKKETITIKEIPIQQTLAKPIQAAALKEQSIKEPAMQKELPKEKQIQRPKVEEKSTQIVIEEKKSHTEATITPEKTKKKAEPKSPFLDALTAYFSSQDIEVLETNVIKKASEVDFTLLVPSAVGKVRFYCKAKAKKKITEGDLSSAYVSGESKKLPVLFLTTGELDKRASVMLTQEFKHMSIKVIK